MRFPVTMRYVAEHPTRRGSLGFFLVLFCSGLSVRFSVMQAHTSGTAFHTNTVSFHRVVCPLLLFGPLFSNHSYARARDWSFITSSAPTAWKPQTAASTVYAAMASKVRTAACRSSGRSPLYLIIFKSPKHFIHPLVRHSRLGWCGLPLQPPTGACGGQPCSQGNDCHEPAHCVGVKSSRAPDFILLLVLSTGRPKPEHHLSAGRRAAHLGQVHGQHAVHAQDQPGYPH